MLKRIIVAVIAIPLIALLILVAPLWSFAVVLAGVAAISAWELLHAIAVLPLRYYIYSCASAAIVSIGFLYGTRFGVVLLGFTALTLLVVTSVEAILAFDTPDAISYEVVMKCLFAGILMPVFLATLTILRAYGLEGHGRMYVVLTVGLAFMTDGGAYFTGMLLGKHRGITNVSPNKSVEGFLGGLAFGIAYAIGFGIVLVLWKHIDVHFAALCIYGLIGALVTEIGDLSFSLMKREYGIKDYGKLIPGHGGMMDRFDSMVFCAPAITLLSVCFAAF